MSIWDLKILKKPELFFMVSIFMFGLVSIFITFPLSNGDEGYHLSKSYNMFSKDEPESMTMEITRYKDSLASSSEINMQEFDVSSFYKNILSDVEQDGIKFRIPVDSGLTLKLDIAHFPSALGVLIGRLIYPSYGSMLIFSRLINLIFFTVCLYYIIKSSRVGKWALVMLFSVPYLQKIASPSYDVFCFIAMAAFSVNLLNLAKYKSFGEVAKTRVLYTLFTILLILLSKNNYIFILPSLLFLPMFTKKMKNWYELLNPNRKLITWLILLVLVCFTIIILNTKLGLVNLSKQFVHNYFNIATVGRRGKTIFSIVSTILPDLFNIIWIVCLFCVMLSEKKYKWPKDFVFLESSLFFINWLGIFVGFYLILGKPTHPFDELSGRYLHPYLICFLPFMQLLHEKYNLSIPKKTVQRVAICSTLFIMTTYLIVCYYRGYVIHTTPTWSNRFG